MRKGFVDFVAESTADEYCEPRLGWQRSRSSHVAVVGTKHQALLPGRVPQFAQAYMGRKRGAQPNRSCS